MAWCQDTRRSTDRRFCVRSRVGRRAFCVPADDRSVRGPNEDFDVVDLDARSGRGIGRPRCADRQLWAALVHRVEFVSPPLHRTPGIGRCASTDELRAVSPSDHDRRHHARDVVAWAGIDGSHVDARHLVIASKVANDQSCGTSAHSHSSRACDHQRDQAEHRQHPRGADEPSADGRRSKDQRKDRDEHAHEDVRSSANSHLTRHARRMPEQAARRSAGGGTEPRAGRPAVRCCPYGLLLAASSGRPQGRVPRIDVGLQALHECLGSNVGLFSDL
jgi:hypothetical protein